MSTPGDCAAFDVRWSASRARLEAELSRAIPSFFRELAPPEIETIQGIIADGKRIRGCLVCLVAEALGGPIEDAIPRAVAIECVQAASLVHDDYIDGDMQRRERPATWTLEGARRAVLLGDVVFAVAIGKMMELGREEGLTVVQAIATMARGAYREIAMPPKRRAPRRSADAKLYNEVIHLKTGALFGAAAKLGALAAGAGRSLAQSAFEWGACTGEAYQIADDLDELDMLARHTERLRPALPRLAPLISCFAGATVSEALLAGAEDDAVLHEAFIRLHPVLERHMRKTIGARVARAAEIGGTLGPRETHWLRTAPAAIVRMNGASAIC